MRALPTALIRSDAERRRTESAQISAITHAHPRYVDSYVAYNEIAAALIGGVEPIEAIAQAQALNLDPDVQAALAVPADRPVRQPLDQGLRNRQPPLRSMGDPTERILRGRSSGTRQ